MNDNIDVSPQNEKPRRINKYVLLAGVAIVAFVVMYLLFSSPGKKSTSIEQVKPNNAATTQNTLGNDERLKRLNEDAEKTKEKETIIQKPAVQQVPTGFLGTPYICEVLTRFGYEDVAYELLLNKKLLDYKRNNKKQ